MQSQFWVQIHFAWAEFSAVAKKTHKKIEISANNLKALRNEGNVLKTLNVDKKLLKLVF